MKNDKKITVLVVCECEIPPKFQRTTISNIAEVGWPICLECGGNMILYDIEIRDEKEDVKT